MDKNKYLERLKALKYCKDIKAAHSEADDILCDILIKLGGLKILQKLMTISLNGMLDTYNQNLMKLTVFIFCNNFGVSPRGKVQEFDSCISWVRIPPPQL